MATYTRQSSSGIVDGGVIEASDLNNEFNQVASAFLQPTFGIGTANTDIVMTFDGETNDGVITWMEDEDYFKISDDLLIETTEKLQFRDTGLYIHSSADGQLDLIADTEIQIAATTVDINGNVDVSGTLTVAGAVDFGDAALSNVGAVQLDSIAGDGDTNTSIAFSGSDVITVTTGGESQFTMNNGSIAPTTDSDVDLGTSSLYFKDAFIDSITTTGNISVGGNLDVTGTFDMSDANITNIGSIALDTITNDGTDITLDSSGDIILDADGANVIIKDDGTSILDIANSSTDVELTVSTADKNFKIKGTDGASAITALDIDMALAGKATFNGDVVVGGDLTITGDDLVMGTNTSGHILVADGTNFNPIAVTDLTEISTAASGDVLLAVDASGGGLKKITRATVIAGTGSSGDLANVVEDTSPQLGGNLDTNSQNILIDDAHFIGDENGNEQIIFQTTSSAVNQFDVTNAATGNAPSLAATGGDSNIDLNLTAKGTGHVSVLGNTNPGTIQFNCEQNSHGVQLKGPAHSAGSSAVLTLPTATGNLVGTGDSGTLPVAAIDIDGATDIGAALVDADLFMVDDGAGGTNRKTAASRIKTYVGAAAGSFSVANLDIDGATDIGADIADADLFVIDDGAGGTNRKVAASRIKTYVASATAADDIGTGDAAVTITTSSGDITIDAAANDSDIIFKGTDGGADTTFLTIDGSAAGAATFNNKVIATELDISGDVDVDGTLEADAITINGTAIASVLSPVAGGASIVTTGALNSGSITSGFGTIDTGSSTITTTGLISGGSLDIDNVLINGTTIGHTDDTDLITVADSLLTIDGDVTITGGTPTLTIGDAGAEDAKIVFDGNAQDFHIGLDDSADDLVIGKGSALGTTPAISIDENLVSTFGAAARGKTLTAGSQSGNVALDFNANQNFVLTATGNVTLTNPSTEAVGQSGIIVFIQDGTGSRTLSTGTDYETPAAAALTISTAANSIDVIPYFVSAANSIKLGAAQIAFG